MQAGCISAWQLRSLGVEAGTIARWARQRWLHPWPGHRGVYTIASRILLPRTARVWAASLWGGPHATVSHRAACGWWALLDGFPRPIDISLPNGRADTCDVRFHRPRLDPADIEIHEGLRVTSVHRALLDTAQTLPDRVNKALANADFHGYLDFKQLDEVMARATRHRGISALREAMRYHHPGFSRTKSRLEDVGLLVVLKAGLPSPLVNAMVCGFEADLWWPEHRLVVEWDGPRHDLPAARAYDRMRDEVIGSNGIRVRRFPERVVYDHPAGVARDIRNSLGGSGLAG